MNPHRAAMTCVTGFLLRSSAVACLAAGAIGAPVPGEPLDPEKAFPATAHLGNEGIDIRFRILDGYYLYGNRFRLETDPGLPLGPAKIPVGETKDDPFIGKTQILRDAALLQLPFTGRPAPGSYAVKVTAQGCAEEKVCYAPFTQVLRVRVPANP